MARTPKVVEDRREQILDAAMRVFAEKGFARATNKDIAEAAGITPGLIYHYFESKEAMFLALLEQRSPLAALRALPPEALALPPAPFLSLVGRQVLAIIEDERFVQLLRAMLPEAVHRPELATNGAMVLRGAVGVLEGYLRAHMASGELVEGDPSLAAQTILGSVMGYVLRRQIFRDPLALQYTHDQIVDAVVSTTLRGLLPR